MISDGAFPFPQRVGDSSAAPRVGDGVILLDSNAEVRYVSPNASSASTDSTVRSRSCCTIQCRALRWCG